MFARTLPNLKPQRRMILIVLSVLFLTIAVNAVTVASQIQLPISGRILFISDYEGLANNVYTREIYSMMLDGSDLRRLTFNDFPEWSASWSPDGTQILFESDRDEETNLYLMNADGSNVRAIPINIPASNPVWSPTGNRIAFSSYVDGNISDIVVANLDGSSLDRLTDGNFWNGDPTWSPDGTRLAFTSDRAGSNQLFTIDVDGSNLQQLTTSNIAHYQPSWSPDGIKMAFVSDGLTETRLGSSNIYLLNLDSGIETQITTEESEGANQPSWSPDGQYIIFRAAEADLTVQIFILNPITGQRITITDFRATNDSPAWQPNNDIVAPTPTLTPTPTPTPAPFQRIRLTALCSASPDSYRVWRVRNPNPRDVVVTWDVYRSATGQNGFVIAPPAQASTPGEVTFITQTEPGPNTVRLFVDGVQQDVRASTTARC
jgi:Tol biopolymer transport system component